MYQEKDLQEIDEKWRKVIFSLPIVDNIHEFILLKFTLLNQKEIKEISDYPYIFGYEFPINPEISGAGNIDLILAKMEELKPSFKVVEFKYLQISSGSNSRVSRRKKRRKLEEQALMNTIELKKIFEDYEVTFSYFTNENLVTYGEKTFKRFLLEEWEKIITIYPFYDFSPI